jgi:FAD dependent oxidoreductase
VAAHQKRIFCKLQKQLKDDFFENVYFFFQKVVAGSAQLLSGPLAQRTCRFSGCLPTTHDATDYGKGWVLSTILVRRCFRTATYSRQNSPRAVTGSQAKLHVSEVICRSKLNLHCSTSSGGCHFVSFTCEPTGLLPYLFERFRKSGGRFVQTKVHSFDDLIEDGNFDMIVNCSGLGSKELVNDGEVKPIRGQVSRVVAPWMFETILDDSEDGNYIIPK